MENNRKNYIYIAAALSILVPSPGRFAYGIVLLLLLNITMALGVLFRKLIEKLNFTDFQPALLGLFFVFVALLYREVLTFISPLMVFTLGFNIYMPAVSAFLIGSLYQKSKDNLLDELKINIKESLMFSIIGLLFFFIRDFFGYGTFTLPVLNGVKEFVILANTDIAFAGAFWASIPGALILTALLYICMSRVSKKFEIVKSMEELDKRGDTLSKPHEGEENA